LAPTKPVALEAYERLAEAYAAKIDRKAHNAFYERPATLSLLPDVAGLDVLDAGCGPGAYSEWLVRRGARVVALDASPRMIEFARARAGSSVEYHVADLEGDLSFLPDAKFDLVLAPLVMDYIADWPPLLGKFHRTLKPSGLFVFSMGHPAFEAEYYNTKRYFEVERVKAVWKGFGPVVEMTSFRRSLSIALNSLVTSGFDLVEVLEPLPTEEFKLSEPVKYERLLLRPAFLCIQARKRPVTRQR
jgi:SAM-dependent methyltransferase